MEAREVIGRLGTEMWFSHTYRHVILGYIDGDSLETQRNGKNRHGMYMVSREALGSEEDRMLDCFC
jgi:hypothetical protein